MYVLMDGDAEALLHDCRAKGAHMLMLEMPWSVGHAVRTCNCTCKPSHPQTVLA